MEFDLNELIESSSLVLFSLGSYGILSFVSTFFIHGKYLHIPYVKYTCFGSLWTAQLDIKSLNHYNKAYRVTYEN